MAVGGGLKAIGTYQSARAQERAADFNRDISLQNAEIAKQQAQADVASLRRKQYQQLGAIRAAVGASGVGIEGSPLDLLESSVSEAALDIQRAEYAGTLRERGYTNDAALYGAESRSARTSGYFFAASDLLMGGANLYSMRLDSGTANAGKPVQVAGSPR